MKSPYDPSDLENPVIPLADKKLLLILDFLAKARGLGCGCRLKELEGMLPPLGIALRGDEHLLLVLMEHEDCAGPDGVGDIEQLVADYPFWEREIRADFQMSSTGRWWTKRQRSSTGMYAE